MKAEKEKIINVDTLCEMIDVIHEAFNTGCLQRALAVKAAKVLIEINEQTTNNPAASYAEWLDQLCPTARDVAERLNAARNEAIAEARKLEAASSAGSA